jgi:hypothetical protein
MVWSLFFFVVVVLVFIPTAPGAMVEGWGERDVCV